MADDDQVFKALADPTRLSIVRELTGSGSVCACDFMSCCDVRQPTVSHHLKVLTTAGFLERSKRGTWAYYKLVPGALDRVSQLLVAS